MITRMLTAALSMLAASSVLAAVDANRASQADLETVKGVGPALSTQILDARRQGPFKDWGDFVRRVKGVGSGSAARLSAGGLTVDGAAFVEADHAARKAGKTKAASPAADGAARDPAPR